MVRAMRLWSLYWLCGIAFTGHSAAQSPLRPPFESHWGDSPEKLITWASQHSMDVNIFLPGNQPAIRILKIQRTSGLLPDSEASSVEARFLGGKLFEMTLHFSDAEATVDQIEARFDLFRKKISTEQGALLSNQRQKTVEDQFVTETQSYHREPVQGLFLLLALTKVEDLTRKKKVAKFSVIYRNDNFRKAIEAQLKTP